MGPASPPPFSKHLSFAGNTRILEIVSTLLKVVLSTPTLAQTSASQTFANSAPFLAFGPFSIMSAYTSSPPSVPAFPPLP